MQKRTPGNSNLEVSAIGLGYMAAIAAKKQATPAQIALAWLLAQKPVDRSDPWHTKLHRLKENLGAADVELTPDDLREIESAAAQIAVQGHRYSAGSQRLIDR